MTTRFSRALAALALGGLVLGGDAAMTAQTSTTTTGGPRTIEKGDYSNIDAATQVLARRTVVQVQLISTSIFAIVQQTNLVRVASEA